MTGEWYNSVSLSPSGTLFSTTRQGSVVAVGATAAFVSSHTRDAVMRATAVPGDGTAVSELAFLCVTVNDSVAAFGAANPASGAAVSNDSHLAAALNTTCALYGKRLLALLRLRIWQVG